MPNTLTPLDSTADAIELPDDVRWLNEVSYTPVQQSTERSITGALIVDVTTATGGRPIELGGDTDSAWITRADLLALQALAAVPGQVFSLQLLGSTYTVIFDHEKTAIEAEPVVDYADPDPTDPYCSLRLRFLETQA